MYIDFPYALEIAQRTIEGIRITTIAVLMLFARMCNNVGK